MVAHTSEILALCMGMCIQRKRHASQTAQYPAFKIIMMMVMVIMLIFTIWK